MTLRDNLPGLARHSASVPEMLEWNKLVGVFIRE
jgi:hypothetical protein